MGHALGATVTVHLDTPQARAVVAAFFRGPLAVFLRSGCGAHFGGRRIDGRRNMLCASRLSATTARRFGALAGAAAKKSEKGDIFEL